MSDSREQIELNDPILFALADIAVEHNIHAWLVGGYVRDHLLGVNVNDIDVTVEGSGVEFAKIVAKEFNSHPVIYERFGTALVPVGDYHLEFVGTRKEEYVADSRKPIVTEGKLEDDLRRRDFTVNALAVSLGGDRRGEIVDLFNGLGDLERNILRTPLDPETTYADDPLRMMRAARFAAQLQFKLEKSSFKAISKMRERIEIISQERISDEFLKTLAAPKPSVGLMILFESGLLELVFPELHALAGVDLVKAEGRSYGHKDVFRHTLQVVDNIAEVTTNVWLRFAALMHDVAKPRTKRFHEGTGWTFHGHEEVGARWQKRIFSRMKLPNKARDYVAKLVRLHHRPMALVDEEVTDSAIRRLVVDAGEELHDLFILCRADITSKNQSKVQRYLANYDHVVERIKEVEEKDRLRAFQSPVRGEEIMEICGIPPSKRVGLLKSAIEEAILDGRIPNEYEAAKAFLMEIKDREDI
ncbi:MAG: HD domain-containing protein [Ignavibacteriae bacterium]|nr:HD domain-containing protein [Ignavibacteriota bacterium]MCB9215884.1 HD domain-containing protein [Ignavibacteria bacterium]